MIIRPGVYRHYKGDLYQVLGMARHTETVEEVVVYQALYGSYALWVRPADMFMGTVQIDGTDVLRFTWVSEGVMKASVMD